MSEHEIPEVKELEEASRDKENRRIGLLISILAIFLAVCGTLGHRAENAEIVARVRASNTWAFFQAKKLRGYQSETTEDLIGLIERGGPGPQREAAQALMQHYKENHQRYEEEAKAVSKAAEDYQQEGDRWESRALRFNLSEIFFQIGVVLCSIAILARNRMFVYGGLGSAVIGIAMAIFAFL